MRKLLSEKYDAEDYAEMDKYLENFNRNLLPNKRYMYATSMVEKNDNIVQYNKIANQRPVSVQHNTVSSANAKQYNGLMSDSIAKASKISQVENNLIAGIIKQESGFDTHASSNRGAQGVMQLTPIAVKELSRMGHHITDVNDPEQNITGGSLLYKKYYDQFGTKELALAAYNAGPGNVRKWMTATKSSDWNTINTYLAKTNQFKETRDYVPNVLSNYNTINQKGKL